MTYRSAPDPVYTLRSARQKERITSVRFFGYNEEERLVSGTGEGNLDVWDLKTFRPASSWNTPDKKGILWLDCHGDCILSQSRKIICRWAPTNSKWIEDVKIPNLSVGFCGCDVNSEGTLLVPTETDGKLQLLSAKTLIVLDEISVASKHGMCMCLKLSMPLIVSGFEDGSIVVWDTRNSKTPLFEEQVCSPDPVTCMDFDANLYQGVSGSPGNSLFIWNINPKGTLSVKQNFCLTNSGLSCVKIRNDQCVFASGGWDSRIRVFHSKTFKPLAVLSHHSDNVTCLDFSQRCVFNHGQLLAAGSNDSSISLWNIYSKFPNQSKC